MTYKFLVSIFILVLLVGTISAFELNPFADKKIFEENISSDMSNFIKTDFNDKYGVIRLSKTFFWFEADKIAEYSLTDNTVQCTLNCEAKGRASLYSNLKLFDGVDFIGTGGVKKNLSNVQYWIKGSETIEVNDFKLECSLATNGTIVICKEVSNGSHLENRDVWNKYNFEVLEKGNYEWRLTGEKEYSANIDFQPLINNQVFSEWAFWNGTGGVITIDGDFTIHTFNSNGTFGWIGDSRNASILVIGGGGGGGGTINNDGTGGGGGAGGSLFNSTFLLTEQNYTVTIGGGGGGAVAQTTTAQNGANTTFATMISVGGGRAGTKNIDANGDVGGSGGGGAGTTNSNGGLGISGQGSDGGDGIAGGPNHGAAGGGGNSSVGADGTTSTGGDGGDGYLNDINGTNFTYSGGGGGGTFDGGTAGTGGSGGGGDGTNDGSNGANGDANTGGGGGGAGATPSASGNGGAGGSGIVIIRYLTFVATAPTVNVFSPTNTTFSASTIFFNATSDETITEFIVNYNGTNITSFTINTTLEVEDGNHHLLLYANGTTSVTAWGLNDTIFFTVDTTPPQITVTFPNETLAFQKVNFNLSVNWTVSDTRLDACILEYDGINTTVTCLDNSTNINITSITNKSLVFYVNDTLGNTNFSSISWNYRLFQNHEIFITSLLEGTSSVFSINLTTNGTDITIGNLSYNDTTNIGAIVQSGDTFEINKTILAPSTSLDVNLSFFWNITQEDSVFFALDSQNQTVLSLNIDNCTLNTNVLYNFTVVDEADQTIILNDGGNANTTTRVDLLILDTGRTLDIANFSKQYDKINPFAVCFNSTMSSGESYVVDVQINYFGDIHEREFYHIQNSTITTEDFPTNITLYDLLNSSSQSFEITFKDSSFLPVEDALIQIQRKYISEGLFRVVEIPKTDTEGRTIGHFVLNDIIYTLIVVKNGVTLGTFNNVRVVCQNPSLEDCTIPLNAVTTTIQPEDFTVLDDFTFTLDYNKTSRVVESIFTIPSSTVADVLLNVTLNDALGNTTVCSDTLTTSSGTLRCTVPFSFGNTSVVVELLKDKVIQGSGIIFLASKPSDTFGANLVFIGIFLYMTLIGLAISSSPMITGFFLILGAILGVSLNLVSGFGFIGAGATILWLIIAIIITLIKGQSRS